MRLRRALCALGAAVLACHPRSAPPAPTPVPAGPPQPSMTLSELDSLLGGASAPGEPGTSTPLDLVARYRQDIRAHLGSPSFYKTFAPKLLRLLTVHTAATPIPLTDLAEGTSATGPYLYDPSRGDCKGKDLVELKPWWDLQLSVRACKDSVRAEITQDAGGQYCDAPDHRFTSQCGCGEHLILCSPPGKKYGDALTQAHRNEVLRTMQYVVENKRPYSSLFLMNGSVRSSFGDYWYRRSAFYQGKPLELPKVTEASFTDFELRDRGPEHAGGILSSPHILYIEQARRVMVQFLWGDLMCTDWKALGVDSHTLLEVAAATPDLRGSINPALVSTPGCQTCHVRLEYGALAFSSFANGLVGSRYVGKPDQAQTKFYGHGEDDFRGEGPSSIDWIAKTLVSQPEFAGCVVKRVTGFAYEGQRVPPELESQLLEHFRKTEDLGQLIEDALIARIFGFVAKSN